MRDASMGGERPVDPSASEDPTTKRSELSRREMLQLSSGVVASLALTGAASAALMAEEQIHSGVGAIAVRFTVNGRARALVLDPRTSLLDALRDHLGLTGAKKGCDHGQCGACTVHLDGRRIVSCLMLAAQANGRAVTTIEGLARPDGALHPMQQAFIDHDAMQCGYCTPGQIMAAVACVHESHAASANDIREYMSGNLCRCGAYVGILAAIQAAAPHMREG